MASLNKVMLLGNLTRDPELRYAPNGTPVATFGLAVNTQRPGQGEERKEEVCFVDVVVFGRQAEVASEYLSKGRQVLIEGRLQWRSWEGQDGQKRSKHEILGERVQFLSRGREDGMERMSPGTGTERPASGAGMGRSNPGPGMERSRPGPARAGSDMDLPPAFEDDDIPF